MHGGRTDQRWRNTFILYVIQEFFFNLWGGKWQVTKKQSVGAEELLRGKKW